MVGKVDGVMSNQTWLAHGLPMTFNIRRLGLLSRKVLPMARSWLRFKKMFSSFPLLRKNSPSNEVSRRLAKLASRRFGCSARRFVGILVTGESVMESRSSVVIPANACSLISWRFVADQSSKPLSFSAPKNVAGLRIRIELMNKTKTSRFLAYLNAFGWIRFSPVPKRSSR